MPSSDSYRGQFNNSVELSTLTPPRMPCIAPKRGQRIAGSNACSRQLLMMNRYSPRRTTQSPLLRHFSVSLQNNSQPSNEVLLREYLFITPIVTEYLIYMTIPLPRTAFVTDSSVCVTISTTTTLIVTEYPIYMTIPLPRAAFVTDSGVCVTISTTTTYPIPVTITPSLSTFCHQNKHFCDNNLPSRRNPTA